MNKRQIKKQMKKVVGYMAVCGHPVYNYVSNREYSGGTCAERDEDCFKFEVIYTRKRYGAPIVLKNRWIETFGNIHK